MNTKILVIIIAAFSCLLAACEGQVPLSSVDGPLIPAASAHPWALIDPGLAGGTLTRTGPGLNRIVTLSNIDSLVERLFPELYYIGGKALEHARSSNETRITIGDINNYVGLTEITGVFHSDSSDNQLGMRITDTAEFTALIHNYAGTQALMYGFDTEDWLYMGGWLSYKSHDSIQYGVLDGFGDSSEITGTIHFVGPYKGRISFNRFVISHGAPAMYLNYSGDVLVVSGGESFVYNFNTDHIDLYK